MRIGAAGLCHSDLSVINGDRPRPMPMALGHESAGVVEAVGEDVTDLVPGDHVVMVFMPSCGHCMPCAEGRPALCEPGAAANGAGTLLSGARRLHCDGVDVNHHLGVSGFADHAVVSRRSVVKIDRDLPLDEAALFGCAVLTGVGAVVNTAGMRPGQSAAVIGLGGVGLSSVLGAVAAGARQVIAIDLSDEKLGLARQIGASHTVNARDADAAEQVRELSGGGVDFAFEMAGAVRAMELAYKITRRGGTTVTAGLPPPDRGAAAAAGATRRRGAHGQRQLYRHLRADARHPALHRAVSRRSPAGRPADERQADARRDQRGIRSPARGPRGASGHRVRLMPPSDFTKPFFDFWKAQTDAFAQAMVPGKFPSGFAAGQGDLAQASQAMLDLWTAAGSLSAALLAKLPSASGSETIDATFRHMLDPRGWLAGGGEMDEVLSRMAEGPRFADLWDMERRYARVMHAWAEMRRRNLEHNAVVLQAWMRAGNTFAKRLGEHGADKPAPDNRALLAMWTEIANAELLETQRSEPFLAAQSGDDPGQHGSANWRSRIWSSMPASNTASRRAPNWTMCIAR